MGDSKGEEWLGKAERKLKSANYSVCTSFSGRTEQFEDAADMFTRAGNSFKIDKKWDKAGLAFTKAAESYISKNEVAQSYLSAALCYKKIQNTKSAVHYIKQAIEFYTEEGRFSIAAKHQKEIAELYEEGSDIENALAAYQTAADYYEAEGSTNTANSCLLKVALLSLQLERYDAAIEVYEKIAARSMNNSLLRWKVKSSYLCAGLCYLATGDLVAAERAIEKYMDEDATFASQRECRFLQDITTASKEYDTEAFTKAVTEYDSISKFESWQTSILLKIRNPILLSVDSLV